MDFRPGSERQASSSDYTRNIAEARFNLSELLYIISLILHVKVDTKTCSRLQSPINHNPWSDAGRHGWKCEQGMLFARISSAGATSLAVMMVDGLRADVNRLFNLRVYLSDMRQGTDR